MAVVPGQGLNHQPFVSSLKGYSMVLTIYHESLTYQYIYSYIITQQPIHSLALLGFTIAKYQRQLFHLRTSSFTNYCHLLDIADIILRNNAHNYWFHCYDCIK